MLLVSAKVSIVFVVFLAPILPGIGKGMGFRRSNPIISPVSTVCRHHHTLLEYDMILVSPVWTDIGK